MLALGAAPAVELLNEAWLPSVGARASFRLDGLGIVYALLACGIGALVLYYARAYVPAHLEEKHRSPCEAVRFYAWIVAFMASMLSSRTPNGEVHVAGPRGGALTRS